MHFARPKFPRIWAVHVLHDYARPNFSAIGLHKLQDLDFEYLLDPAHSSSLLTSNNHVFRTLSIHCRKNMSNKECHLKTERSNFSNVRQGQARGAIWLSQIRIPFLLSPNLKTRPQTRTGWVVSDLNDNNDSTNDRDSQYLIIIVEPKTGSSFAFELQFLNSF